jgi:hypothetical protein
MYEPRFYRDFGACAGMEKFEVVEGESDLFVLCDRDVRTEIAELLRSFRAQINDYIKSDPGFQFALEPYIISQSAPEIIRKMAFETAKVGVGPMASVAGAVAEFIGRELAGLCSDLIIENGGDIYIKASVPRKIGIYAGSSGFSGKIALAIEPEDTPLGVCTSSGTVGPSLSFGRADAACVIASSAAFADACATAVGNMVKDESDIEKALCLPNP